MAKKMRTINNPLDRGTRNDLNYNFTTLESNLSEGIEDINEKLDDALDGRQMEELFDAAADARKEAESARNQSAYANEKGKYANEKGAYANKQGTYAKEQGDYAKEKAEYAAEKTSEIEQAHTDLSQIKVEAVDATQKANTQAARAKVEADRAKPLVDKVETELPNIENLKHVGEWSGSKDYKKNEEVLYNGASYRAKRNNTGETPSTSIADWQLIAQRGVDGKGAVSSVNNIQPDELGNVDLGNLATEEYVDEKIHGVDFSSLETKIDATTKLNEAKEYTDTKTTNMETTTGAQAKVNTHANKTDNPHNVTKSQVGLGNVDNTKQMPISGGTYTGIAKAHNNTSYTVSQLRNVVASTGEPVSNQWANGDIWVVYE